MRQTFRIHHIALIWMGCDMVLQGWGLDLDQSKAHLNSNLKVTYWFGGRYGLSGMCILWSPGLRMGLAMSLGSPGQGSLVIKCKFHPTYSQHERELKKKICYVLPPPTLGCPVKKLKHQSRSFNWYQTPLHPHV